MSAEFQMMDEVVSYQEFQQGKSPDGKRIVDFARLGLALRQLISQKLRSSGKISAHVFEHSLGLLLEALPCPETGPPLRHCPMEKEVNGTMSYNYKGD